MLKQTPWGVARKGYQALSELQKPFAISAVEPRADEQMQLAYGTLPATLVEREQNTAEALALLYQPQKD
jgi:hypothetical protein